MKHLLTIIVLWVLAVLPSGKASAAAPPADSAETRPLQLAQKYYAIGDFDQALRYGLLAVSAGEQIGDTTLTMSDCYYRVSLLYLLTQDFEKAVWYGKKGRDIAAVHGNIPKVYECTSYIAAALSKLHRYDDALSELRKTQKTFPTRDPAILLVSHLRYLNIYLDEGRPDLAKGYASIVLHMFNAPPAGGDLFKQWYLGISRYYFANKEYTKLVAFLSAYAPGRGYDLPASGRLTVYERMFLADSTLGRYQDALAAHILFKALSDSIFNEKKSRQIAQLNAQFDSERKDKKLLLQQQQLQLTAERLGRSQASKQLFGYIIAGMVLITGLLTSLYRMKVSKNLALTRRQHEIDDKNEKLVQLVHEKDWLLKEVHHRVKNNLQIILSLLNSQGMFVKDGVAFEAIRDSQARVQSMAMIHQKLYTSPGALTIDLKEYIADLVNYFRDSYVARQRTEFCLELAPLPADVSVAVPLALIVNEAITNALKHAFPNGKAGLIRIAVIALPNDNIELTIADNGIGLPVGFDPQRQSSLGISLILGLTEDIGGKCIIDGSKGTMVRIIFSEDRLNNVLSARKTSPHPFATL